MRFLTIILMLFSSLTVFAYSVDDDVPADVKSQMENDLTFMKSIKGAQVSDLHKEIFGQMDGTVYGKWFEDRVTAVGMSTCGSSIAVACVIPFLDPSKIWLTKNYIQFSHPQIARMMVVYHEARHTETAHGNWPHANCPTPFKDKDGNEIKSIWTGSSLAGEAACDETPLGSYGSSTILLKNVSRFCTTCTDKVKMDAGLYADDQFKRMIDQSTIDQMKKDGEGPSKRMLAVQHIPHQQAL